MQYFVKASLLLGALLISGLMLSLSAQAPDHSDLHRKEMKKMDFMVGNWAGEGWMMGRDQKKSTFQQTEKVQWKLDSTIIMVEGTGKVGDRVVHNALAIISYNPEREAYDFQSFLATGQGGQHRATIADDQTMIWYLENPNGTIRYTITINEQGQWFEIGEFQMGPDQWVQFFEMTLDKVED